MYTKKQLEDILHRRLLWHEYSDKGTYVAGAKFNDADPIEVITHLDPDKVERCHIKCAGVSEMLPVKDFKSGAQCVKCVERTTPSMYACSVRSTGASYYACDLTSDFEEGARSGSRIAVPAGCPHATKDAVELDDDRREYKYWAYMVSGVQHAKKLTPYSWKIVETADKLTLSIQYRLRYLDGKNMDTVCSSMYCHISCNLKTGMTYMSDIHSDKGHVRRASYTNHMETITFAKGLYLLPYMPNYHALKEPLAALYNALKTKLSEMGYSCTEPSMPIGQGWSAPVLSGTKFKNPDELLIAIAALNRFPNLGKYVLPVEWRQMVSLYLRRRFDHLPKDVSNKTLAGALGLPDTPCLRDCVENDSRNAVIAVMLNEWGFTDEDIEKFAMKGFKNVLSTIDHIVAHQNKHARTYEMFDMLSIAAPVHLIYGAKHHTPVADSFDLVLQGSSTSIIQQKMRKTMKGTLLRPFQKKNVKWTPSCDSLLFEWSPHRGSFAFIKIASKERQLSELSVSMTLYLDRRAWNKKEARKLVEWLKALNAEPNSESTQELGKHVKETLLRSMRFSPELMHIRSIDGTASEQECRIVYEWAYKNNVEVNRNIESQYDSAKSVSKSIRQRTEKKRKAKRDAKAKKQGV